MSPVTERVPGKPDKNTISMTLMLDEKHDAVLAGIAEELHMSKSGVMRQALRLYQIVYERAKKGQQMAFIQSGVAVPMHIPSMSPLVPQEPQP